LYSLKGTTGTDTNAVVPKAFLIHGLVKQQWVGRGLVDVIGSVSDPFSLLARCAHAPSCF